MIKIAREKGMGKTAEIINIASSVNGIIVCGDVKRMREFMHMTGFGGQAEVISYEDYYEYLFNAENSDESDNDTAFDICNKKIFIDDISNFLQILDNNISGYTDTISIKRDYE